MTKYPDRVIGEFQIFWTIRATPLDNAQLNTGFWIKRPYRFRKTGKPVHAGYKDVLEAAVFQFG